MPIECPHCGKSMRAPDSAAGRRVKCPRCQEAFRVSAPAADDGDGEDISGKVTTRPPVAGPRPAAPRPERSRKQKVRAKAKKRGASPVVVLVAMGGIVLLLGLVGGGAWMVMRGRDGGGATEKPVANNEPAAPVGAFAVEKGPITYAAFTPSGKHIFSCALDGSVSLWDVATGQRIKTLVVPAASCAALAPDGKHAVVGTNEGALKLLDLDKWQEERTFAGHQLKGAKSIVTAVDFTVNSSRVVSTGLDYSVRAWDTKTGQEVWHKDRYDNIGTPRGVTCHPGGVIVFVAYSQGAVVMYNVGDEHPLSQYNPVAFANKMVQSVVTNKSGRLLAAGDAPEVVVMDQAGTQTGTFRGHPANTLTAALASDGHRAISGGLDKVVRVWDVQTC